MFARTFIGISLLALTLNTVEAAQPTNKNQKGEFMGYTIEVIETHAQPALVSKGKTKFEDAGAAIGGAIGKVGKHLEKVNQSPTGAPFARMLDIKDGVLEYEAGFPVTNTVTAEVEIYKTELPAGTMATTIHVGSQETSELAYQALHAWMAQNNKSEAGAPWEVYLTDESTPADLARMQVFYPVR